MEALRERYESLISRVQSFGRYYFDNVPGGAIPPAMLALFRSAKFVAAARAVCPPGKQHLDPFQPGDAFAPNTLRHIEAAAFHTARAPKNISLRFSGDREPQRRGQRPPPHR